MNNLQNKLLQFVLLIDFLGINGLFMYQVHTSLFIKTNFKNVVISFKLFGYRERPVLK